MENDTQEILNRLKNIELTMEFIKKSMPNKDMFLDSEERVLLEESYAQEKTKSLVSSKDARKQLGI